MYSEPEIDALFQRLVGDRECVEPDDAAMVSIYDLSFRYGMNNQTFWNLVAEGRLTGLRMAKGQHFIEGLRVELAQVMQIICGLDAAMTRAEVSTFLGVDTNIVRILEANDLLKRFPADPNYSNKLGHLFDPTQVECFKRDYMPLQQVRHCFDDHPSLQRLKTMGLQPAIHLKPISKAPGYAIFFKREDVRRFA